MRWKKLGVWGSFLGEILSNPEEGWLCFFKDIWLPVRTSIPVSSSPCSLRQTSTFLMVLMGAALHQQSLGVWNGSGPIITRFRGLHCSTLKTRLTLCLNLQESTTLMLACPIPFTFPICTRTLLSTKFKDGLSTGTVSSLEVGVCLRNKVQLEQHKIQSAKYAK